MNAILAALLLQPQASLLPAFPIVINMALLARAPVTPPRATRAHCAPIPPATPREQPQPADAWTNMEHEVSVRKLRVRAKRSGDNVAKHKRRAQPSRHSDRLRAKESATFEDMPSKATRLKALKNELSTCSKELKVQVKRSGLLRKRTLNAADLRAMAGTANLSTKATARLNKVLAGSK